MTTSVVDSNTDRRRGVRAHRAKWRCASRGRVQRPHPDQVVGRGGEEKLPVHARPATVAEFAQPADRLHPAEDFLDAFARDLADGVAGVTRRPTVECPTLLL